MWRGIPSAGGLYLLGSFILWSKIWPNYPTTITNITSNDTSATIKRALIDTRAWPTRDGLRRGLFEYIKGWYNTRRLHSTLGYLGPAQYEARLHKADRQAA